MAMKAARFESAGIRLPIALGFVMPVFVLSLAIPHLTRTNGTLLGALLSSLVACGLGVAAYVAYVRRIERRPVTELALPGAGKEIGSGFVLGAALFAIAIGTLALLGDYNVHGRHDLAIVAIPLVAAIGTAFIEEIIYSKLQACRLFQDGQRSFTSMLPSVRHVALAFLQRNTRSCAHSI